MTIHTTKVDGVDTVYAADVNDLQSAVVTGWIPAIGTWTYASASTITIPTDGTTTYQKGMKIRFKQGAGYKYYVASAVTATQITVFVNTDYTVANAAITDVYYSFVESPYGWPDYFALGTPTWTTSGTPFTNQPGSNVFKAVIMGKRIKVSGYATTNATSGGTGAFTATFPAGTLPVAVLYTAGSAHNFSDNIVGNSSISATLNTILCNKYDSDTLAGNSKLFSFDITYVW